MAFGIGNVGAGGGSMDVDFGTGRDGELFIDVNNTITLPVTTETGSIDKHYTSGYIDVNGILQPQARHRYSILRFAGDLTLRGTIDWTGSGAMHDSRYGEMPYLFTAGEYDEQDRPKFVLPALNLYGNAPVFGGNGGAGGNGEPLASWSISGGAGTAGNIGNTLGGGAGGNGGGGCWYYGGASSAHGSAAAASSWDYAGSTSYGYGGYGGGSGPGAGGSNYAYPAAIPGTAFPGGLLVIVVSGNVQVTASGKISNNGRNGANGAASTYLPSGTYGGSHSAGGKGGGGGGGIVMLLHGGNLSNAGTISVTGGAAGVGGTGGAAGTIGSIMTKKVA